ncbi:MAG: HAD family phosphatase, partial [Candidatus Bathyarchaeia archaeon]
MIHGVKSVIFDMDGVLIESEPLYFEATEKIFKRSFNISIAPYFIEAIGRRSEEALSHYISKLGLEVKPQHLVERQLEEYCALLKEKTPLVPGSVELINALKSRYRLALASSAKPEPVRIVLSKLGGHGLFEVVVTGDDVSYGKPDPEIYLTAAHRLGLSPTRCLASEASENA